MCHVNVYGKHAIVFKPNIKQIGLDCMNIWVEVVHW